MVIDAGTIEATPMENTPNADAAPVDVKVEVTDESPKAPAKKKTAKGGNKATSPFTQSRGSYMDPHDFVKMVGQIEGQNIRKDYGDIQAFAETILAVGRIFSPIEIRKTTADDLAKMPEGTEFPYTYVVNGDGSRRHAAIGHIVLTLKKGDDLAKIPVQVAQDTSHLTRLTRMLVTGSDDSQKPLHWLEEADGMRQMRDDFEMDVPEIARKTGRRREAVRNRLALLDAEDVVQKAASDPDIGIGLAYKIARKVKDSEEQAKFVKRCKKSDAEKRQVQRELGMIGSKTKRAEAAEKKAEEAEKDAGKAKEDMRKVGKRCTEIVTAQLQKLEGILSAIQAGEYKTQSKALKGMSVDVEPDELVEFIGKTAERKVAFAWGMVQGAMAVNNLAGHDPWQVSEGEVPKGKPQADDTDDDGDDEE